MKRVLIVDDDEQGLHSNRRILELEGYEVVACIHGGQAFAHLSKDCDFDAILSDLRMPELSGIELLAGLRKIRVDVPFVLMTAYGEVGDAVEAMKLGAVDFIAKPFKRSKLLEVMQNAVARSRRKKPRVAVSSSWISKSPAMQALNSSIERVAATRASVLIHGESGSGKELVAKAIHDQSTRKGQAWVAFNCAALSESLIEAELFGVDRGAYTGAINSRPGLFEAASHGTIFLDEIAELPMNLQPKLLRVLQESEVRRVGSTLVRKVDVRVIAATHQDLKKKVELGEFREDLYYRLQVVQLEVPALRTRLADLPDLVQDLLQRVDRDHGVRIDGVSDEVMAVFKQYRWPGNVRELSNVLARAAVMAEGRVIALSDLPEHLSADLLLQRPTSDESIEIKVGTSLKEVEDLLIKRTLEATSGNKELTARMLGINSRTIYRRLQNPSE